ncbi:CheY-P phosphatase CheX [Paraliobacillus quinghaiensis]|uniref:CheY-P phosphatase CheX n=1 Tax=Paraliobacillus quinghaiensis TaxID=470815 RepID=A0A917TSC2_9BACI|nr:chemotaxis protein CheX [Paraliobacillus quinghaiensis]GGM35976.1 CheY-P phosphatase CheX [Paraliobacillus quinghaiensis]
MDNKNINEVIKEIYNGTIFTVKKVIPMEPEVGAPKLIASPLTVKFGVLIGFTGDLKGELVLQANHELFSEIGEAMFGMPLSEEMLDSFAGELGNMVAGSLSTYLAELEIHTDITHPTVMKGDASLSGFKRALLVKVGYGNEKELEIYLLLSQ